MRKPDKITQYWIKHAAYDLESAKVMLDGCRYLYVTFMCQQAIEKLLKAIITTISKEFPPRIHNLTRLSELAKVNSKLDQKQKDLLAILTPFCIETRYAEYTEKMSKLADKKLAVEYLQKTKELLKCLKEMI
ncbi:MAG: HEPN domain-containing protein [Candidatus Saganbacteria bacterium]|uniref:HEPN domain-containing protein n=1 Tax=Candidatus Saganbacteria bacterium TaxID=2575572 RepID=A0A833L2F7_UNCSA|nr:MAG: HEPN domain-containing protein [Candidatus Saganbacteria bacterium]